MALSQMTRRLTDVLDAYVIGSGLSELAAALELVEVGLSVRIGLPAAHPALDQGARFSAPGAAWGDDTRPVPDAEGAIADVLGRVADTSEAPAGTVGASRVRGSAAAAPRPSAAGAALLRDAKGGWAPQPTPAILGIPAVPLSSRAVAVLGGAGATRAYLDRIKPVLTIGKTHELDPLVRSRLGGAAVQRLTDPFVRARFGLSAEEVEVAVAAPGLNEALTRTGSLSGAVLALSEHDVARETRVAPAGGWAALGDALVERLGWYGAEFEEHPVGAVARDDEGWRIEAGGATVRARSLVLGVDADSSTAAAARAFDLPGREEVVGSPRVRAHAEFSIAEPGLPDSPEGEAPALGRTVAIQAVDVAGEGRWAVELLRGEGEAWRAHVSGPAGSAVPPSDADLMRAATEAVAQAGVVPLAGAPTSLAVRIAPFATTGERAAALARLEVQRAEDRELLLVGDALHGGDLSVAVADARLAAVHLRRRLTGIAD